MKVMTFILVAVAVIIAVMLSLQHWQEYNYRYTGIERALYIPEGVVDNSLELQECVAKGSRTLTLTMKVDGYSQRQLYSDVLTFLKSKGYKVDKNWQSVRDKGMKELEQYKDTEKYTIMVESTSHDWVGIYSGCTVCFIVFPDYEPNDPKRAEILAHPEKEHRQKLTYIVWIR